MFGIVRLLAIYNLIPESSCFSLILKRTKSQMNPVRIFSFEGSINQWIPQPFGEACISTESNGQEHARCLLLLKPSYQGRLHAEFYQVFAQPFHQYVALLGSHRLVVYANDECQPCLHHGDASRSLENKTKKVFCLGIERQMWSAFTC